jgi:hypothetical protein
MVEYETPMKPFFNFLKIPMMSHKHWLYSISWMFVDFMYKEMLQKAK